MTPATKLVLMAIQNWGYGTDYCHPAVETIAKATALSENTTRGALKSLVSLGLIRIEQDSTNRTGKRIVRLWMSDPDLHPTKVATSSLGPKFGPKVSLGPNFEPALGSKFCGSTLGPKFGPERTLLGEQTEGIAATEPGPPILISTLSEERAEVKIDTDLLDKIIGRTIEVYSSDEATIRPRVEVLARSVQLSWIARAIEDVADVARREAVGWGLLRKILDDYRRDGGPPPPRTQRPSTNPASEELVEPPVYEAPWIRAQRLERDRMSDPKLMEILIKRNRPAGLLESDTK